MAEEAIKFEVENAEEWGKITPPEKSEKVAVEYQKLWTKEGSPLLV